MHVPLVLLREEPGRAHPNALSAHRKGRSNVFAGCNATGNEHRHVAGGFNNLRDQ